MYEFGEVSGLLCTESLMCDCCNLLGYPFKLLCSFSEIHIFVGHYVTFICLSRYSWCSKRLFKKSDTDANHSLSLDDLIPLETCNHESGASTSRREVPRLIVGHNVSFDRSFIKEQYFIEVKASY